MAYEWIIGRVTCGNRSKRWKLKLSEIFSTDVKSISNMIKIREKHMILQQEG
jgi:hypothetical protein